MHTSKHTSKSLLALSQTIPGRSIQFASRRPSPTLVIVDPSVEDSVALTQAINEEAEIVLLDSRRNGLEQVTEVLVRHCQIQHLQIISLGCPGKLKLGSIWLDFAMLEAARSMLQSWQTAFTPETTILFYDCTIALGTEGMAFVGQLSQLTGALVSVSYSPYSQEW